MKKYMAIIVFLWAAECWGMGHRPEHVAADSAWLAGLQGRLEKADTVFAGAGWQYMTGGEYPDYMEKTIREYFWLIFSDYNIKKLDRIQGLFEDSTVNRTARLSYIKYLSIWSEVDSDVRMISNYLTDIMIRHRAEFEGEARTDNYLAEIIRNASERERRETAWLVRAAIGDSLAPYLIDLVRERNRLARSKDYDDYFEFQINIMGLTTDRVLGFLGMLNRATRDPYLEIYERKKEELDLESLELWDIPYDPEFSDFNDRFKKDSLMSTLKNTFGALGFDTTMNKITFDIEPRENKYQHAICAPIQVPGDIRILASIENGFDSYRMVFHEFGHALHLTHIDQPYYILRVSTDGAIGEAMATICEDILTRPDWLRKYAGLNNSELTNISEKLRENRIIGIRFLLADIYFELELYRSDADNPDKLYWDIMEKLVYCVRQDGTNAWASIPHLVTTPIYMQNYILADLIAAQTMHHMRALNGDIIDNPATARYLVDRYFKYGALYNWFDLVEIATGEKLNTKYYLEDILGESPEAVKNDVEKTGN